MEIFIYACHFPSYMLRVQKPLEKVVLEDASSAHPHNPIKNAIGFFKRSQLLLVTNATAATLFSVAAGSNYTSGNKTAGVLATTASLLLWTTTYLSARTNINNYESMIESNQHSAPENDYETSV